MRARLTPLLVSGVLGIAAGCALFGGEPEKDVSDWYEVRPDLLWDAALEVVQQEFGVEKADVIDRTFESKWKVQLSPFRKEGRRRRVTGRVEVEGSKARLELCAEVEMNKEIDHPLELQAAEWKRISDDRQTTSIIQKRVHLVLTSSGALKQR